MAFTQAQLQSIKTPNAPSFDPNASTMQTLPGASAGKNAIQQVADVGQKINDFGAGAVAAAGYNFANDVGQTIAKGIFDQQSPDAFSKLPQTDQTNVSNLFTMMHTAAQNGNDALANHFADSIKNYQYVNGTKLSDVFPVLNKSNEQIIGDALGAATTAATAGLGSTAGLVTGELGSVAAPTAEEAAAQGAKTLLAKVLPKAAEGAAVGTSYGASQGLSTNQNAAGVAKEAAIGGATGAILGGATAAAPSALDAASEALSKPSVPTPVAESALSKATTDLQTATQARQTAGQTAVDALGKATDQVSAYKDSLGDAFKNAAIGIEKTTPDARLNLDSSTVDALRDIKTSKTFLLPKSVSDAIPDIGNVSSGTEVALKPSDAQQLITQLNKNTYTRMADGSLKVNQAIVDLTDQIKADASKSFGKDWRTAYSNYSQGIGAIKSLKDVVSLDSQLTPTKLNANLNRIVKLGSTPEGKVILQQALDDLKNAPGGVDLTKPINSVQDIIKSQNDLEAAQKVFDEVKKMEDAKVPISQQVKHILSMKNVPSYVIRRVIGGTIVSAILGYGAFKRK